MPQRPGDTAREDALLALALASAVQLEIWIWWVEAEQGLKPVAALLGLAMTVPLLWRRRRPPPSFAGVLAVYVVWVAAAPPRGSLAPYLVVLVAVYSVAAHTPPRRSWVALGAAVGAEALLVVRTTNDLADYAFILTFLLGAWLAGRGMRVRQQRADELFTRAVTAEVEREERARAAVTEERGRIARELHDVISHSVSVMVVQAGAAEEVLDRDPDQVRTSLRAIQQTGRDTRLELRRLLGVLRTGGEDGPDYQPQPGLAQLAGLADRLSNSGVTVELNTEGTPRPLPSGVDLAAYRIAQEALTNALKHGGGCVSVAVRYGRDAVEIEVIDDGRPGSGTDGSGMGLVGMRERAALYGGELEHGRRAGGGYRVRARLPVPPGTS